VVPCLYDLQTWTRRFSGRPPDYVTYGKSIFFRYR
jgi:hypothetical protein